MMKFISPLSFDIRHSLFIIRYSFLVPACPGCGTENLLINKDCLACGMSLGFPNVNECSQQEELEALDKRYKKKIEFVRKKGHQDKVIKFEEEVKKSLAVINVDLEYLHSLIVRCAPYSNYQLLTSGEARDFARPEADKERLGVEGTIFGSYGRNIRYAVLSLDGSGLKSYGDFTIILADKAVGLRATLLEENSYKFVKRHKILAGGKIPKGYRAVWKDRHKLAVAKLAEKAMLTKKGNYAIIVLENTGNRKKDDFIEVHIYGKISKESVQAVRGNSKDTENILECTPYEESLFFNSDTEIKVFGNIAIDELRKTLVKEKSNFDALYGAIGGFDRNLSEKTRILSIQRAESLVKDPEIFNFVIFRLFGNPVPKAAALKKAVKLSIKNGFQEMSSVYKRLLNSGDVIEYILSIFKDTIWELSLEKEFVMLKNIFISSGIFAKLFLNITATTKGLDELEKIVNEFSDNDHIKENIPSIYKILTLMESKIKNKFIENSDHYDHDIVWLDQIGKIKGWGFIELEYPDAKKGVSFVKMKDPPYENKKRKTDKPTTSKKQK